MIVCIGTDFPGERQRSEPALPGSFNSEALVVLKIVGNNVSEEERIWLHRRIREVIQAADGSVWLLTDYKEGELIRLSPVKDQNFSKK